MFYRRFTLENFMSITQDPDLFIESEEVSNVREHENNNSENSSACCLKIIWRWLKKILS